MTLIEQFCAAVPCVAFTLSARMCYGISGLSCSFSLLACKLWSLWSFHVLLNVLLLCHSLLVATTPHLYRWRKKINKNRSAWVNTRNPHLNQKQKSESFAARPVPTSTCDLRAEYFLLGIPLTELILQWLLCPGEDSCLWCHDRAVYPIWDKFHTCTKRPHIPR